MDDLCQIGRLYYFAYGSNLKRNRLRERVGFVHTYHKGFIKDYSLVFNKKSIDESSKANIRSNGSKVWGVCYELDDDGYEKLKGHEEGYNERDVAVYDEEDKLFIIAKTFTSKQISENAPKKDYVKLIIEGAKENDLPETYIQQVIESSNYHMLG